MKLLTTNFEILPVPRFKDHKEEQLSFTALYFSQFFTYGFDKKEIGSQDIQDWFRKNPTQVTLIKCLDIKR
jgi:hypothetical protein